jgi:hypothetical protein
MGMPLCLRHSFARAHATRSSTPFAFSISRFYVKGIIPPFSLALLFCALHI